jgi:hypothetical protein
VPKLPKLDFETIGRSRIDRPLFWWDCHSADYVLRNAALPPVEEGDILAVMDSGAYFLSFEGNFGLPRPAVAAVRNGTASLMRRAETYEDTLSGSKSMWLRHDPSR